MVRTFRRAPHLASDFDAYTHGTPRLAPAFIGSFPADQLRAPIHRHPETQVPGFVAKRRKRGHSTCQRPARLTGHGRNGVPISRRRRVFDSRHSSVTAEAFSASSQGAHYRTASDLPDKAAAAVRGPPMKHGPHAARRGRADAPAAAAPQPTCCFHPKGPRHLRLRVRRFPSTNPLSHSERFSAEGKSGFPSDRSLACGTSHRTRANPLRKN